MNKTLIFGAICFLSLIVGTQSAHASQSDGTILDGTTMTKICQNTACTEYGNINWKPTINADTTGATAVIITDSTVSGWLWGDQIGWVNMQPTGAGVTINSVTGALSGYAWSTVGSWINFSPTGVSGGTPVGVTINSQGQFTGWAWVSGLNGGWMKFDCSDPTTCISTDWRPTSALTPAPVAVGNGPVVGSLGPFSSGLSSSTISSPPSISIGTGIATTTISGIQSAVFTRFLRRGNVGSDVKELQVFLNSRGFLVAQTGPGSTGHETSTFGPATKAALIRFQNAYASIILTPQGLIAGTGFFGQATLKEVNQLLK